MAGLNDRPSSERLHIGFFGLRNAGKSSVVNAVTGQKLSLVSDVKGTTTDPVQKAMVLLPIGPVVIIDTPGIDDEGELGEMRVLRAKQALEGTDIAAAVPAEQSSNRINVSAATGKNIYALKELIGKLAGLQKNEKQLVGDLIEQGDIIVLVTPIDESAPKGRMILPQQQMIRDVLDNGAINTVTKETELTAALASLKQKPRMVITDSQAFGKVSRIVPEDILLTSEYR